MNLQRRQILKGSGAALLALPLMAGAQAWPARPIRLVVPFPPGGLVDSMARLIGPRLAQELGQPVVIDNKPGAGGNLGAAEVARATPDGYTLLMASPPLTISPALYATLPYRPEQIVPIGLIGRVPNVLLVNPKSGINTVADLVARARKTPGQLNYASNGNGTSLHLSAELFKTTTGTFITHIPYRGAAQAVTGLMAGEVDLMFENLPSVLGQIQGGGVKAPAVTTRQRSKALPGVPTLIESGLADFDVSAWYGVAAPAGTPAAVLARIEQALDKLARDPEIARAMESRGAEVGFLGANADERLHGGRCDQVETRRRVRKNHPGLNGEQHEHSDACRPDRSGGDGQRHGAIAAPRRAPAARLRCAHRGRAGLCQRRWRGLRLAARAGRRLRRGGLGGGQRRADRGGAVRPGRRRQRLRRGR
jgi:tripartite-type tricarboxylate transporter receptor subunit TctC